MTSQKQGLCTNYEYNLRRISQAYISSRSSFVLDSTSVLSKHSKESNVGVATLMHFENKYGFNIDFFCLSLVEY